MERRMKLKNLKCSMYTEGLVKDGLRRSETYSFKLDSVTVFIFGHTPNLVNMTGLECFEDVETTREMIEFGYDVKCTDIRVDNIFISHKDRRNLDMSKVYDYARLMYFTLYLVDYNKIQDKDFKSAINVILNNRGVYNQNGNFGSYEVSYGGIIQEGYECNEEMHNLDESDNSIPEISVMTNY